MFKLKTVVAAAALLGNTAAFAATGNVGVVSEYLFRGIEQSGGAAVQGGLDWSNASGFYIGGWASNTGGPAASGGTEVDLYGGWTGKAGELGLDFGGIYYQFNEDEEDVSPGLPPGAPTDFDYFEVYGKLSLSYFGLQVYYAPDYLGDANEFAANGVGKDTDFLYVNLLGNFPLSPTLTLGLQVGQSSGDGAEVAWGDEYLDYSVSLTKTLDNGFSYSLGAYNTSLDAGQGFGTVPFDEDGPKVVVGLKKTFDL